MKELLIGVVVPLLLMSIPPFSQAAEPIRSAPAIHVAIAANAETPIAVQVQPKATCTFLDGDPTRKIFANDEGVIRMNVRPKQEGTGTISLECMGEDGARVVYPVELAPTSHPGILAATRARMKPLFESNPGTVRPALPGDPMAYTQGELLAGGYGRRPDPATEADRYAHWLRAVTEPSTIVSSRQVEGPGSNGPNDNPSWGPRWSGGVAGNPLGAWPKSRGAYFWYASAEWRVPQVFAESNAWNQSNASTWAGLGSGNTAADFLWQAGTEEWTQSLLWFQVAGYNAWTQLFPYQQTQQNISNFNVNNGDDIYVEVFVCDLGTGWENPTFYGNYGLCAHLHNYTQKEEPPIIRMSWPPVFPRLQQAEVIQERPNNSFGGQNDYAQFNAFNFLSTLVCASDGRNFVGGCNPISLNGPPSLIPGPSPFSVQMDGIGSASHRIGESCLADHYGNCDNNGDYVRVWWDAHS
jgi:hypothetical protein